MINLVTVILKGDKGETSQLIRGDIMNRLASQCEFFKRIQFVPSFLGVFVCFLLFGCGTASQRQAAFDAPNQPITQSSKNKPLSEQQIKKTEKPFNSPLPLGIGARLDLFVSEYSNNISSVYSSYIKPMRNGKIFDDRPYKLDYAILPSKGDTFSQTSKLGDISIKSDYDFRVGVSRRFQHFSDFFNVDFLLGKGRYSASEEHSNYQVSSQEIVPIFENKDDHVLPNIPYDGPLVDLDTLVGK